MINDFYTNKTIISLAAVLWSVKQHTLPLLGGREQGALCDIPANGYEEDYLNYGFFFEGTLSFPFCFTFNLYVRVGGNPFNYSSSKRKM